jgi:hypothetical protein
MARSDWFDDGKDMPVIDEQMSKLEHFVASMADGVIEKDELAKQQSAVVAAMKAVEGDLNDAQHANVTQLLMELSAYNVMRLLHELQTKRLERFTSR